MIGIVIVAHGGLAREYRTVLEHVVGVSPGIVAISIGADDNSQSKCGEIADAIAEVDAGDGVVVVTDMYGGTPSNLAIFACSASDHRVITGINMPLLIKLAQMRGQRIDLAVKSALNNGRKYISCVDGFGALETPVAL